MCNVANAFVLFHQIIKAAAAKRKVHEMTKCYIRDFQPSKKMAVCQNECKMEWIGGGDRCMQ